MHETDPIQPEQTEILPVRRRVHGLAFPALPTWPLIAQVSGGAAALYGTYGQFGRDIALIVGGLAVAVLGMLREAGKV